MRVAIPTFGSEVSPRFCFAREALVVELEEGRELARAVVELGDAGYPVRLQLLAERGAELLICGGFNRAFLGEAERLGVHILWNVCGAAEDAVRRLLAGSLGLRTHPDCWCRRHPISGVAQRSRSNHPGAATTPPGDPTTTGARDAGQQAGRSRL